MCVTLGASSFRGPWRAGGRYDEVGASCLVDKCRVLFCRLWRLAVLVVVFVGLTSGQLDFFMGAEDVTPEPTEGATDLEYDMAEVATTGPRLTLQVEQSSDMLPELDTGNGGGEHEEESEGGKDGKEYDEEEGDEEVNKDDNVESEEAEGPAILLGVPESGYIDPSELMGPQVETIYTG